MKLLHPTACDFMVYKDYKNQPLKFIFPICGINFRIQHLTCLLLDHRVTINHNISLKSLPYKLSHCIFHQLLIIYFLINDLLLLKFIQTCHTGGGIWTKNNLFVPCDGLVDGFFKSSFVFVQFWCGIFNFFASSNSDALFIYL